MPTNYQIAISAIFMFGMSILEGVTTNYQKRITPFRSLTFTGRYLPTDEAYKVQWCAK
ncbi:MAG: hypothetical protein AAF655_05875 [Bacteroidota bacterium]